MDIYLDKYALNLTKLNSDNERTQEFITRIYQDLISNYRDYTLHNTGRNSEGDKISQSYFNTLYYNGYLIDIRDIKLNQILEE